MRLQAWLIWRIEEGSHGHGWAGGLLGDGQYTGFEPCVGACCKCGEAGGARLAETYTAYRAHTPMPPELLARPN